ncbi:Glycerol kinase [Candidatus Lokiarchaeum ossiferum]
MIIVSETQLQEKKYILSIDSGGTGIRAILFNKQGEIVDREYEKTLPMFPEDGALEHDPEILWDALKSVVNKIFAKPTYSPEEIAAIGICNQRASFCFVEKKTGKPLTNLISWADVRAEKTTMKMRKKFLYRGLVAIAKLFGKISGNTMLTTTGMLKLTPEFALCRVRWLYEQKEVKYRDSKLSGQQLYDMAKNEEIHFCTLDSWFMYKLTGGKQHITDVTNASGTALYNPFDLVWNKIYTKLFDIPHNDTFFPKVLDNDGDFGTTDPEIFGNVAIPIGASIGDQMSSLFGHCCFEPGEVKISQGSGAFVDMTVGLKPKLSKRGLFPLIAWKLNGNVTYMLEGQVTTAGTLIDWIGEGIGLADTPKVLNEFAAQTEDTEGVIVIPTPSGMNFPHFNPNTRAAIFGLSLATHRRHVCRAVLEGLALRLYDILEGMSHDTKIDIKDIKVDGGVSQSDIELQCLANFANINVERAPESDMTATGAAYFAGLSIGFWKDQEELRSLQKNYNAFSPKMTLEKRDKKLKQWRKAVKAVLKIQ